MTIREAVPEDAATIAHVHVASWKTTYAGIIPQVHLDALSVEDRAAGWQKHIKDKANTILVVEDEAGVFGFAAGRAIMHPVEGYEAELGAIYLLESHQRRGAGTALMRRMAADLQRQGFHNMVVWVLRLNPACGFYQRLGGMQAAEQTIEIGGEMLLEVAFGWPEIAALCED